jgi:hypothetical protein
VGASGDGAIGTEDKALAKFNASRTLNTLMTVLAAAFAWQLHGLLIGIATLVFLWAVRGWTANRITWRYIERAAERDEEPDMVKLLRLTMASRWAWVIFVFIALAASAAEFCIGLTCRNIWS